MVQTTSNSRSTPYWLQAQIGKSATRDMVLPDQRQITDMPQMQWSRLLNLLPPHRRIPLPATANPIATSPHHHTLVLQKQRHTIATAPTSCEDTAKVRQEHPRHLQSFVLAHHHLWRKCGFVQFAQCQRAWGETCQQGTEIRCAYLQCRHWRVERLKLAFCCLVHAYRLEALLHVSNLQIRLCG